VTAATWDALVVGATAESGELPPLTQHDFVRYAGASGDFNPIHFDDEFARAAGFPSVFSQGMLQAGILATFLTDWLGAARVRQFRVQFREQVWPGDRLVCRATVVERVERDAERRVRLEIECTRGTGGGVAVRGDATFVVP
jgi:acyl dehydratase